MKCSKCALYPQSPADLRDYERVTAGRRCPRRERGDFPAANDAACGDFVSRVLREEQE